MTFPEGEFTPSEIERQKRMAMQERITQRVKEKFPNNLDTSVVILNWAHHAAERRRMPDVEYFAQRDFRKMEKTK